MEKSKKNLKKVYAIILENSKNSAKFLYWVHCIPNRSDKGY